MVNELGNKSSNPGSGLFGPSLCSSARHLTLTEPLSTEACQRVWVNSWGEGGKPAMDFLFHTGGVEILLVAREIGISSLDMGHLTYQMLKIPSVCYFSD